MFFNLRVVYSFDFICARETFSWKIQQENELINNYVFSKIRNNNKQSYIFLKKISIFADNLF
jgi:hypothetical protein